MPEVLTDVQEKIEWSLHRCTLTVPHYLCRLLLVYPIRDLLVLNIIMVSVAISVVNPFNEDLEAIFVESFLSGTSSRVEPVQL